MEDITLTFGKHAGKKLSEVPVSYVRWLSEQPAICGKRDIPEAAHAYLATLPLSVANALRYSIPTTEEEASKLAWMAGKGNHEAARTLLAARNADGYIPVDFEDADGEIGYFFVFESGRGGYFAGTQADIDEDAREAEEVARQEAKWLASPDLAWVSQTGEPIRLWVTYEDDDGTIVLEARLGHGDPEPVEGVLLTDSLTQVSVSQQRWAKAHGIVAVIFTRQGNIGLTAERKAVLEAAVGKHPAEKEEGKN